jgi:ATP-dependent RNA helicase DDX1
MVTLTPDGLAAQCRQEKEWGGVRASSGVTGGRAYYEVVMRDEGLCRVGWSTASASLDLGTDKGGYGFGGTGKKSNNRSFEAYGEEFASGDVIGCCLDHSAADTVRISWMKNGKHLGEAFSVTAGGKGGLSGALYPTVCMKNAELLVNFGTAGWKHAPPPGFAGVQSLEEAHTVEAGSAPAAPTNGAGVGRKGNPVMPQCIILAPARDLAEQTHNAVADLSKHVAPGIGSLLIIGGMKDSFLKDQMKALPGGAAELITATPGKLLDSLKAGEVCLSSLRLLILDEADRFAEKEMMEMVRDLWAKIRAATTAAPLKVQVCFFSATLHSREISALSELLCTHPTWVDLKGKDSVPETVHHVIADVDPAASRSWWSEAGCVEGGLTDGVHKADGGSLASKGPLNALTGSEGVKRTKLRMLVGLIDSLRMEQCIIFCRTNVDCDKVEAYLTAAGGGQKWSRGKEKGKENPYSCCVLAGMRSQDERRRNLDAFREADVRFLVATDVAARGLDIKELPYVINMTLPDEIENYIHRIGRVGRVGRMGLAISLVSTVAEKVWYHKCKDRGKGCSDARLAETGGCTIMYDERKLLEGIKKRIHVEDIPRMCVTSGVAAGAGGGAGKGPSYVFTLPEGMSDGVVYGEERRVVSGPSAHVSELERAVKALASLEVAAQSSYLSIKAKRR